MDVEEIGTAAFIDNTSIQKLSFLGDAIKIGYGAFTGCNHLADVELPQSTILDNFAFSGCSSLQSMDLSTVEAMNSYAFYNCTSLTSVILPTESKILEEVASKLGDNRNATGAIHLFTERPPCESCKGVLRNSVPNILTFS